MPSTLIHMVPMLIADNTHDKVLPPKNLDLIERIDAYFAENVRTTRRFLRSCGIQRSIEDLDFQELNKHTSSRDIESFLAKHKGKEIGVISESGCPGVADPGAHVVQLAHLKGIKVIPHVGPSSILMALMASGFNGQRFSFQGYLPIDKKECERALRNFEQRSARESESILFIETPYRNQRLTSLLLSALSNNTKLLIGSGISGQQESIEVKSIGDWKKQGIELEKIPTIFGLEAT